MKLIRTILEKKREKENFKINRTVIFFFFLSKRRDETKKKTSDTLHFDSPLFTVKIYNKRIIIKSKSLYIYI